MQFFLQSCKNGLCSAEIGHVILKRRLKDLFQKSFPIVHKLLLVFKISNHFIFPPTVLERSIVDNNLSL